MSSSKDTQSSQDTESEIEDNGSEHGTGSKDANNRERDETESEDANSGESDQSDSSLTDKDKFPIRLPSGLYNEVEIYHQFMNFVREGCSTSGATVYVVSPFITDITARQLLEHTAWGLLCQKDLTAEFNKLSTKGCGSHPYKSLEDIEKAFQCILKSGFEDELNQLVKTCEKLAPRIKLYMREKQIENEKLLRLLRTLCDIYLQPTYNHYFHCKWAAVTNGKNTEVLLTSANLIDSHMKKEHEGYFQQTNSLSYLTISTEEFKENFLDQLAFCT